MIKSDAVEQYLAPHFRKLVQEISQHPSALLCQSNASGASKSAQPTPKPAANRFHPAQSQPNQVLARTTGSPEAQDSKKQELQRKETFNLAMDAVFLKIGQAQAETDRAKRGERLVEAQLLMTEFLNMGRDPSISNGARDAVKDTLKFYLTECRRLAPNYVDLPWVQGATGTPSQSYSQVETLIRKDPSLQPLYRAWEERQAALGLRPSRELQEVQKTPAKNTK